MDVVTFAPSVQMSLSIALSIDYSLFLLGRYREELQLNHKEHDQSVVQMLRHAGPQLGRSTAKEPSSFTHSTLAPANPRRR